jgi:hypothetical protein
MMVNIKIITYSGDCKNQNNDEAEKQKQNKSKQTQEEIN